MQNLTNGLDEREKFREEVQRRISEKISEKITERMKNLQLGSKRELLRVPEIDGTNGKMESDCRRTFIEALGRSLVQTFLQCTHCNEPTASRSTCQKGTESASHENVPCRLDRVCHRPTHRTLRSRLCFDLLCTSI